MTLGKLSILSEPMGGSAMYADSSYRQSMRDSGRAQTDQYGLVVPIRHFLFTIRQEAILLGVEESSDRAMRVRVKTTEDC